MKLHPAQQSPVDLSVMHQPIEVLSIESFSSINLPGVFRSLAQGVKDTFQHVHGFVAVQDVPKLPRDQRKFLSAIHTTNYDTLRHIKAVRPEGLKSHYLEYMEDLIKVAKHSAMVQSDVVSPYFEFLTRFSAGNQFSTSAASETSEFRKKAKLREDMLKQLGSHFGKEGYSTKATVGEVIARNNDWEKVLHQLAELNDIVNGVDRQQLINTTKACTDLIDVIIGQFSAMSDRRASKESAERLYNHAYNVGRELELYATVHYRTLALQSSVQDTMTGIMEIYA